MENKVYENSDEFFNDYSAKEGNQYCFDCKAAAPQWASVNNGILICLSCSSTHRLLGLQVSLVRSITLDIWTDKQINLMRQGGNLQVREYLEKYDLENEDAKVKFNTKAAQFHRKRLAALASNQ
jgi:hypothetical protein